MADLAPNLLRSPEFEINRPENIDAVAD